MCALPDLCVAGKECAPPATLQSLPPKAIKRQEAIFELITTEQSYADSLRLVKEVFFEPMEEANVLRIDELARVKVNWDDLIKGSEKCLK